MGDNAQWAAALSPLIPALLGGGLLHAFKDWMYSEKEMTGIVERAAQALVEKVCRAHDALLGAINRGEPTRGQPPHKPDYVAEYATELQRSSRLTFRFELIRMECQGGHSALLFTAVAGIVLCLGALLLKGFDITGLSSQVACAAVGLLVTQAIVVARLRALRNLVDRINEAL